MPRWTPEQLAAYEQKRDRSSAPGAIAEPPVCHEPVAAPEREAEYTGRFRVRIVSKRRKLCDPDNLCPKYFVDCLRYAGIIPNDRPQDIELSVTQEKVGLKGEERTVIEVGPL